CHRSELYQPNSHSSLVRQPFTGRTVIVERRLTAFKHNVDIDVAPSDSHRHTPTDALSESDIHDILDVMVFRCIVQRFFQDVIPDRLEGEEAILFVGRGGYEMRFDGVAADDRTP